MRSLNIFPLMGFFYGFGYLIFNLFEIVKVSLFQSYGSTLKKYIASTGGGVFARRNAELSVVLKPKKISLLSTFDNGSPENLYFKSYVIDFIAKAATNRYGYLNLDLFVEEQTRNFLRDNISELYSFDERDLNRYSAPILVNKVN